MPIRAVLDTNILVSGLLAQFGASHAIIERLRAGGLLLIVSAELVREYESVMSRPFIARRSGYTQAEIRAYLDGVIRSAESIALLDASPIAIRDVNDSQVLETALAGRADFLMTGDEDLLAIEDHPALGLLTIIKPRPFLAALDAFTNGMGST